MPVFFLGHTLIARGTVDPAPIAKNLRDPAVIERHRAEAVEAAARIAPTIPFVGEVDTVCLLEAGKPTTKHREAETGPELVSVLSAAFPRNQSLLWLPGAVAAATTQVQVRTFDDDFYVFGLGARDCIRVAVAEAFASQRALDDWDGGAVIPTALFRGEYGIYDPYEVIVHSAHRAHLPLWRLLAASGFRMPSGMPLDADAERVIRSNATLGCLAARHLAIAWGLYPDAADHVDEIAS